MHFSCCMTSPEGTLHLLSETILHHLIAAIWISVYFICLMNLAKENFCLEKYVIIRNDFMGSYAKGRGCQCGVCGV